MPLQLRFLESLQCDVFRLHSIFDVPESILYLISRSRLKIVV